MEFKIFNKTYILTDKSTINKIINEGINANLNKKPLPEMDKKEDCITIDEIKEVMKYYDIESLKGTRIINKLLMNKFFNEEY